MKKKLIYYLFSLIFMLGAASCSKEGPIGPKGAQGEQGIKGEQGIPGTDGKMIRYGTGVPTSDLGNDGDFYINITSHALYGPKTSSGWGAGTSLIGRPGDKGDKGSQFLSGIKNPTADIGNVGDFYFNTNNGTIYGPKTSTGWGTGVNLNGNANVNEGQGWVVLDEINGNSSKWKRSSHIDGGSYNSGEPGDIGQPFVYNWWLGSFKSHSGITLLYLDDGSITKMTPFKKSVYKEENGVVVMDAILEFRFAMITTTTIGDWYLYPIIAVKEGTVNDDYLINTYVKTLKWKAVNIPANAINNKNIDFQDYQAVKEVLSLKD